MCATSEKYSQNRKILLYKYKYNREQTYFLKHSIFPTEIIIYYFFFIRYSFFPVRPYNAERKTIAKKI